jgi:hypothetical protein
MPRSLEVQELYSTYSAPTMMRKVIASTTQSLYGIMTNGASLAVEQAVTMNISLEDLEDIMNTI